MKLLLDSCVWGPAKRELSEAGHDVIWTGDWERDPGDEEILARAFVEQRILITLDKNILRLVGISARRQGGVCSHVLGSHGEQLLRGAIVTVEPGRIRVRSLEAD